MPETVETAPSYREAFRKRRCLLPADGFYEWRTIGGAKIPFAIEMKDDRPFAFAGLLGGVERSGYRGGYVPGGLSPATRTNCCPSSHCPIFLGGFLQGSVLALDQNRAMVAARQMTDTGGNLWTCYRQRRQFVTSTLASHSEVSNIRPFRST